MSCRDTLRDLFRHNDWARDALLAVARGCTDPQLDQPFEMGEGSLRATLNHLWSAERVWLDRWKKAPQPRYRPDAAGVSIAGLSADFAATAAERDEFLDRQDDRALAEPLTYANVRGEVATLPLRSLMLHVCNHGVHHRAQAINMLRQLGIPLPKPGLDYIFYRLALQSQPDSHVPAFESGQSAPTSATRTGPAARSTKPPPA